MSDSDNYEKGTDNSAATTSAGTATMEGPAQDFEQDLDTGQDLNVKNQFLELFQSWQGMLVMIGGVILPGLLILSYVYACHERMTLLILKHPVESLVELSLALMIPIGNFTIWSNLVKCDYRAQLKRGLLSGIALGSASIISIVAFAAICLGYPVHSLNGTNHGAAVFIIGSIFLAAASVSVYLILEVKKTRIVESGRIRAIAVATLGVLIATLAFAGAEARSICIKFAEHLAISEDPEKQAEGMKTLRWLYPKKELNMECANYKAIGLPGMFVKLDNITLRQLYFQVTGEPFRDDKSANFSTMPDDYLQKHVVGKPVTDLSLHRSKMLGHINPDTLSSTIYWNFVFKNKSYSPQEARVELGLPEGAVISGMTIWKNGSPQGTMFKPTMENPGTVSWTTNDHGSPGVITDLGRGRVLLHCYPVPAQDQLRAAVAITIPAKLHTIDQASLPLPRIIDANFTMEGDHRIKMISKEEINLSTEGLKQIKQKNGTFVISGEVSSETISGAGISVAISRKPNYGPISIQDNLAKKPRFVSQTIKKVPASAPQRLLVVLDGSESVKPHLDNIKEVLAKVSPEIEANLILATKLDKKTSLKEMSLAEAVKSLTKDDFVGGQDNLESVVKATELAAEAKGGAVLWIHGPQPSFNKEIYILNPFTEKPGFFELALDNGIMNANEFFKHHKDIGPFTPIARSSHPASDLSRFLSKWTPGGFEYVVQYQATSMPVGAVLEDKEQIRELGALFARERCALMLAKNSVQEAVEEAVLHRIVTPVSLASTVLSPEEPSASSLAEGMHNRSVQIAGENGQTEIDRLAQSDTQNATIENTIAMVREDRRLNYSANTDAFSTESTTETVDPAYASLILQGATNGSIGPQGGDATAIMGVNTAGTVRVNNLANLEALLNLLANALEILAMATGGLVLASVFFKSENETNAIFSSSRATKVMVGLGLILAGLSAPGFVNYFIASARDANLFS